MGVKARATRAAGELQHALGTRPRAGGSRRALALVAALAAAASVGSGCGGEAGSTSTASGGPRSNGGAGDPGDDAAAMAAIAAREQAAAQQPPEPRLLAWLAPDASAAALVREPLPFSAADLEEVFALPPRATALLRALERTITAIELAAPEGAPPWFGGPYLVMQPGMAQRPTIVARARLPRDELDPALTASGWRRHEIEGYTTYEPPPKGSVRLVLLGRPGEPASADLVALAPASDVGSGLSPLTAARDLPASELEGELLRASQADPAVAVELFVAGPMLHLDLDDDVLGVRLSARRWDGGSAGVGADVGVLVQPIGDAEAARRTLEARALPLASAQARALAERVAYTVDAGGFITGRLQLTADDIRAIGGRGWGTPP